MTTSFLTFPARSNRKHFSAILDGANSDTLLDFSPVSSPLFPFFVGCILYCCRGVNGYTNMKCPDYHKIFLRTFVVGERPTRHTDSTPGVKTIDAKDANISKQSQNILCILNRRHIKFACGRETPLAAKVVMRSR